LLFSIHRYALWTEEHANNISMRSGGRVQGIHPQVLGGLSG